MPEGHLIHRQAAWLSDHFLGEPVRASSPQGRFNGALIVDGLTVTEVFAHGKHLFIGFSVPGVGVTHWVHIHLGLYGKWRFVEATVAAQTAVKGSERLRLEGNGVVADLTGPNRCELIDDVELRTIRSRLGPDPLSADAMGEEIFVARMRSRAVKIGQLVMDQSVVAGPGNIYRAECLFRVGISPHRLGCNTADQRLRRLWRDLSESMLRGMASGVISTVDPDDVPVRRFGGDEEAQRFYVYHRSGRPCLKCGSAVQESLLQGRRLFWCGRCQR